MRVGTEANRAGRLWFFLSSPAARLTSHCARDAMEQADQVELGGTIVQVQLIKCIQMHPVTFFSFSFSFPFSFFLSFSFFSFPWPFSLSFLSFPSPDTSNTSNQDKEATCRTIQTVQPSFHDFYFCCSDLGRLVDKLVIVGQCITRNRMELLFEQVMLSDEDAKQSKHRKNLAAHESQSSEIHCTSVA